MPIFVGEIVCETSDPRRHRDGALVVKKGPGAPGTQVGRQLGAICRARAGIDINQWYIMSSSSGSVNCGTRMPTSASIY